MKNLRSLKGVNELSKNEQKTIAGGRPLCMLDIWNNPCPEGWQCYGYECVNPNPTPPPTPD